MSNSKSAQKGKFASLSHLDSKVNLNFASHFQYARNLQEQVKEVNPKDVDVATKAIQTAHGPSATLHLQKYPQMLT